MNRFKATIILIIVSFGFLLTYPFHTSFLGGILSSGFCAAMIGGFADWFGVTALFRKPLGVSYRTEIIPKNREKIFDALSDMVGKELLTKENLKKLLNKHNMSSLVLKFLSRNNEKEQLKEITNKILRDILAKINPKETGDFVERIVKDNISKVKLIYIIETAVDISIKNGYDDRFVNFILEELERLSKHDQAKDLITKLVEETIRTYESGSKRRMFTNTLIFDMLLHSSPSDIAGIIQVRLVDYLNELKNSEHPSRQKLIEWIREKIEDLKGNSGVQQKLEDWKLEFIEKKLDISAVVEEFISKYRTTNIGESEGYIRLSNAIGDQIDNFISKFNDNENWQSKFDDYTKKALLDFVENNHSEISVMVRENLDKYTNDMLIDLIESKAGNDLQMIRINGSIVGGFVGVVTFILTFWIS